jgi:ankyrin repeat protein
MNKILPNSIDIFGDDMLPTLRSIFKDPSHLLFLERERYDLDSRLDEPHPKTGCFLIHKAAEYDQKEIVAILLQEGIDVDFSVPEWDEFYGQTPLNIALSMENESTASFLLDQKADVEKCDLKGEFPLVKSARVGDCEKIKSLIAEGANVNKENLINPHAPSPHLPFKHRNALMYALENSRLSAATLLLDLGSAIVNSQGQSVLDYCTNNLVRKRIEEDIKTRCPVIREKYQNLVANNTPLPKAITEIVCSHMPEYYHASNFFKLYNEKLGRSKAPETTSDGQEKPCKKHRVG